MKKLLFAFYLISVVFVVAPNSSAQDGTKTEASSQAQVKVNEIDALKIENLTLKIREAQRIHETLIAQREQLAREAAKKDGVEWDKYDIDIFGHMWILKKEKAK